MHQPNDNNQLTDRLRAALDEQANNLDADTLARLQQARQAALAGKTTAPGFRQRLSLRYSLVPAGGFATAALAAMLWWGQPAPTTPTGVQDFELLTADASLELLEELEFAEWLMFAVEEEAHVAG